MAIELKKLNEKTTLRTRAGHEVVSWSVVEKPAETFFPLRAKIRLEDGSVVEMPFNHNGRRFMNTASEYDLFVMLPKRNRQSTEKLDTMPDVMTAIECARRGDFHGVISANKYKWASVSSDDKLRYNYIIGRSDEGLG